MAELKLPRLLAAAKEFNVGQDTLIDYLIGKGFPKDDLKPTSKLTEDMYRALQQEFQSDKAAKMKSDQVDLPKGAAAEAKKKKEEEEIVFKKEEKKTVKKEEPKPEEIPVVVEEVKPVEVPKKEEEVVVKVEAPEIEKPKVLDKI
ncbi:MAG: translation initiation factor IF-2, partial [Chitinophagaceae bacterium]|nr:translation initiation factor IF-2 [Chitinophagaceae bacterium]